MLVSRRVIEFLVVVCVLDAGSCCWIEMCLFMGK